MECVAIWGVGLIGSSIGLALKARGLCRNVFGIGRRPESLETARQCGAIDTWSTDCDASLAAAQLLVVCVPVDRIVESVHRAAAFLQPDAVVTDAGSTKTSIVHALDGRSDGTPKFVGSHPLAGSEKRGPESGSASLFDGRTCIVTPTKLTDTAALRQVVDFWTCLGMHVVEMRADDHDRVLAMTSHMPHLVACALALALEPEDHRYAASGFRDMTRVASGDPSIWAPIFELNQGALFSALDGLQTRLSQLRSLVGQGDLDAIRRLLQEAKERRDALGN